MGKTTLIQEYRQEMAALGCDLNDFTDDELIEGARQVAEVAVSLCVTLGESLTQTLVDLADAANCTIQQFSEAFNQAVET